MCVVSNIGSYQRQQWDQQWPTHGGLISALQSNLVSKSEFESLKAEVTALKTLLEAAKQFDQATNQPACESEEKVAVIKTVAKLLGIDMGKVFEK